LGLFFILAKQERGLFYTDLRCVVFHSANRGTGGFYRADFGTVAFLLDSFLGFFGLFCWLARFGLVSFRFWGAFCSLIA